MTPIEPSELLQSLNEWFNAQEFKDLYEDMEWPRGGCGICRKASTPVLFVFLPFIVGIAALLHWLVEHNLRAALAHTEMLRLSPEDELYHTVLA